MRKIISIFLLLLILLTNVYGFTPYQKPHLGLQINWANPLSKGLAGFWLLNEGSGNKVFDLSGNGKDGIFVGGTEWTAGKFGSAVNFPTANDSVNFGTAFRMGLSDLSGVVWAKITTSQSIQSFIHAGATGTTIEGWHFRFDTASNNFYFAISNGTTRGVYASNTGLNVADGNWHFCAFSAVRSGNITFYLDGIAVGTANISGRSAEDIQGSEDLTLSSSSSIFDLLGAIDNAVLYNRALSASGIAELYREPFGMFVKDDIAILATAAEPPPPPTGQVITIIMTSIPLFLIPFFFIKRRKLCR